MQVFSLTNDVFRNVSPQTTQIKTYPRLTESLFYKVVFWSLSVCFLFICPTQWDA